MDDRVSKKQKPAPPSSLMPFSPMPDKIKYIGPKEECNLETDMPLVEGLTNFVKFKILDTCMSHTYEYSVRELVHVWKEEKEVLSVISK